MIIVDYKRQNHKKIVSACATALKAGKVVAYPTDTSYGLAADAENIKAIKKLYRIKERQSTKPVHVIVPSLTYAKKIVSWNKIANRLVTKFWPGPLTLILRLKATNSKIKILSAKTGCLGVRYPKNQIALDLAKYLNRPITTTSANPSAHISGGYDSYSAEDIVNQFKDKKYKPDIIINAGKLPKRKPSTMVKILDSKLDFLRIGPVSETQIKRALK